MPRSRRAAVEILLVASALLVGLWLRVGYLDRTVFDHPVRADARQYVRSALNLLHRGVYSSQSGEDPAPDLRRSPGYPLLLVAVLLAEDSRPDELSGQAFDRVLAIQAGLSLLAVGLLYGAARRSLPPLERTLLVWLGAIDPFLISFSGYLLSEVLYLFGLVASCALLARAFERGGPGLFAAAGAAFGFSLLVRPVLLLLPAGALAAVGLARRLRPAIAVRGLLLASLVAYGVYAPWAIRAFQLEGSVLGSSGAARSLVAVGLYPGLRYQQGPAGSPHKEDPGFPEWSRSPGAILAHAADEFGRDPLGMTRWFALGKIRMLWQWSIVAGQGDVFVYPVEASPYLNGSGIHGLTHRLARLAYPLLLLACAVGGVLRLARRSWLDRLGVPRSVLFDLLWCLLGFVTLLHVALAPYPRYSVPFRLLAYPMGLAILCGTGRALVRAARPGSRPPGADATAREW